MFCEYKADFQTRDVLNSIPFNLFLGSMFVLLGNGLFSVGCKREVANTRLSRNHRI